MSDLKEDSSSVSGRQQQHLHSLQHRKAFEIGDPDQNLLQPQHDSNEPLTHTTSPSNTDETHSITAGPPDDGPRQPSTTFTDAQSHTTVADPTPSVAEEKPLTKNTANTANTRSTTSPPRRAHDDNLTASDLLFLTLTLSPALLHLWGRCFAQTSTPRQIGTWFAILTLPISAPLYRKETLLPSSVRDVLELVSYGSAFTIAVDLMVALYKNITAYPPTSESEWLIFYPAVVAAVVCWAAVVGLLWGLVVV